MAFNYKKGRHFLVTFDEVIKMIFADDLDEEVDRLNDKDITVLSEADELGKSTVVIATGDLRDSVVDN